jgi:hypothetical protein
VHLIRHERPLEFSAHRAGLERLLLYVLRPALALKQLTYVRFSDQADRDLGGKPITISEQADQCRRHRGYPEPRKAAAATAANFLAVAAFVLLGTWASVPIRQAMILLPLFVITESYVKRMRADSANRRSYLIGLTGSALGMIGAELLFLRSAPIH